MKYIQVFPGYRLEFQLYLFGDYSILSSYDIYTMIHKYSMCMMFVALLQLLKNINLHFFLQGVI